MLSKKSLYEQINKKIYNPKNDKDDGLKCKGTTCDGYLTTYGEITFDGMNIVSDYVTKYRKLYPTKNKEKVFMDLGSGFGRFPIYKALFELYDESHGIEIADQRYSQAEAARQILVNKKYPGATNIYFHNGSFLDPKYEPIINKASLIFISNLCFDDTTQIDLFKTLNKNLPANCLIFCSKVMPSNDEVSFDRIKYVKEITVPMTWYNDSKLNIYRIN